MSENKSYRILDSGRMIPFDDSDAQIDSWLDEILKLRGEKAVLLACCHHVRKQLAAFDVYKHLVRRLDEAIKNAGGNADGL